MNPQEIRGPEPFWKTVRLLWKAARRRHLGRAERQRKLLRQRKGSSSNPLGALAIVISVIFMGAIHGFLGFMTAESVKAGGLVAAERTGKMAVSVHFIDSVRRSPSPQNIESAIDIEAWHRTASFGSTHETEKAAIREHYRRHGAAGFVRLDNFSGNLHTLIQAPPLAKLAGFTMLLWWFVMLTMQGEGLELDVQRRRHPMWEWLLSHPVRPQAAFLAEMVSPLVSNPAYISAPVYWTVLLTHLWGFWIALGCSIVIGIVLAAAAACLNKTLELCAMLKLSVRSRGAVLGLMSWLGYALFIIPLFLFGRPGVMPRPA